MAGVADRFGETGASPYLLPVSVDGRPITRDQLRATLRVSNATAGELLRLVRTEPAPPVPSASAGNGTRPLIGELTR